MPRAKNVSTQKNENSASTRNAPRKMIAMGEPKAERSSLRVIASTGLIAPPYAAMASWLKTVSSVRVSGRSSRKGQPCWRASS